MIVVLMGVSGSGKSTLAAELVKRTGWAFAEGDDYHSEANREKMKAGIPLTDEDRTPWLDALRGVLEGWRKEGKSGILTCSALKRSYRVRLMGEVEGVRLVWLDPDRGTLEFRMAHRTGHYMNPNLLDSQIATLEPPEGAEVLRLTGGGSAEEAADRVLSWVGN